MKGNEQMAKLLVCNSCGAQFSNDEPKCPYCGTMNYDGAEKEYFEKLEDIREDVEDLNAVPMQETKAELKKQGKFIKNVIVIVVVLGLVFGGIIFLQEKSYERDEKADFLWREENYPKMNAMYEAGEYEELAEFYMQALADNQQLYDWEHSDFVDTYISVQEFYDDLEYMEKYDDISDGMYTVIFSNQWSIYKYAVSDEMTEDEKAYFSEVFVLVEEHLRNDWDMDETTFQEFASRFEEPYGYISWDECEDYIKAWRKGKK